MDFKPLSEVERVPYEEAFLIGNLLTTRMTYLTGEPKAGKSLFAAGMIRALVEGHEQFIGQPVLRQIDNVVYGYTDDGADAELRGRFEGTKAFDALSVLQVHELEDDDDWLELRDGLVLPCVSG